MSASGDPRHLQRVTCGDGTVLCSILEGYDMTNLGYVKDFNCVWRLPSTNDLFCTDGWQVEADGFGL